MNATPFRISLLLLALLMGLSAVASAQSPSPEEIEPLPIPVDWRERSGIGVGLEIKNIAEIEGTPFDASLVQPNGRPAIGLDVVRRGRNVLILEDNDGAIRRASFGGQAAWQQVLRVLYSIYPDRFDMVMALTEWQERSAFAYYLPLSNDTRGLGYLHLSGRDVFDSTGSELDGLIFMNDYRTYLGRNAVLGRIVFLQEIGHRWGSFVYYANGPGNGRDMLGRDQSHWSFFLSAPNSALEGNVWRDNSNGSFTTNTNAFRLGFSELDLYLMGFLPSNQVRDFFLITGPDVRGQRDSFGQTINPASAPAFERNITINGTRQNITVEDVITSEGPRNPGFDSSQKVWNVATVLILNQGSSFDDGDQVLVENLLDDWEEMFETETRNVPDLVLTLEDTPVTPDRDFGDACTATAECDPAVATVCLTTDEGRICSRRCADADECGQGFCCGEGFCYPSGVALCQAQLPETCTEDLDCGFGCCVEGQCAQGEACAEDPNNDPNNDPDDCDDPDDGFVKPGCECVGFGCPPPTPNVGSGTGSVRETCQAASPLSPASPTAALALLALAGLGLIARRRA